VQNPATLIRQGAKILNNKSFAATVSEYIVNSGNKEADKQGAWKTSLTTIANALKA